MFATQDAELKALNNTNEEGEVIRFDSDSTNIFIDSCVEGGLTGFRSDFIEGTFVEIEKQTSYITTGKSSIIDEGIMDHTLKDDNGEDHTLHTRMAYDPSSKYRLMAPQWLRIQDKE